VPAPLRTAQALVEAGVHPGEERERPDEQHEGEKSDFHTLSIGSAVD